jgi:IclR family pca regulon transcriptional regulator
MVNEELEEGLISLAAPVRDRQGRVIAALNVSGQTRRTSTAVMRENVLPVLQAAADEVSQLLRNRG